MRTVICCLIMFCSTSMKAQLDSKVDSISNELCLYLKSLQGSDSTILYTLYDKQWESFLKTVDEHKLEKVEQVLFFRLQRNCVAFSDLLNRLDGGSDYFIMKETKPESVISPEQIRAFKQQNLFYYYENNDAMTHVLIEDGYWIESFPDQTVSKLYIEWIGETTFKLVFIDSDNLMKSNFSQEGDEYYYEILNQGEDYYTLIVYIPGQDRYYQFKLFYFQ